MWNKLSMKDRAEYIKLGVANGITDLSTIRDVYNKYAEGGPIEDTTNKTPDDQPQQEEFYYAPWLNENMFGVVPYKDYFFKDWFPERKKAFGESYPHNTKEDDAMYNLLNTVREYYNNYYSLDNPDLSPDEREVAKYFSAHKDDGMAAKMTLLDRNATPFLADALTNPTYGGVYMPNAGHVIGYNYPNLTRVIHERTHALQPREFEKPIIERISNDTEQQFLQSGKKHDKYLDDEKEIYARLMQLRHDLGLNPAKRDYKAEDIRNEYGKDAYGYDIFDRYSDEFINFLLNDVVYNNIDYTDNINYAAYGGYINKYNKHSSNKYAEGGLKDSWKPWYWFTPEYEGSSLKEALFKAMDDGLEGKNIMYNGKAYKVSLNDTDLKEYNIKKQHRLNRSITNEQVVDSYIDNVLYTMENPNNTGYKGGKYYPYADISSKKNIGPGINYTSNMAEGLDFSGKKGYTKEELNEKIRPHLLENMEGIMSDLHDMYGEDIDTMSLGNRMILLDISHNVRPRGKKRANMPKGWPSLVKGMMSGDSSEARKNTNSGSTRRQNMRNDLLWQNIVDENTVKNR